MTSPLHAAKSGHYFTVDLEIIWDIVRNLARETSTLPVLRQARKREARSRRDSKCVVNAFVEAIPSARLVRAEEGAGDDESIDTRLYAENLSVHRL
jgi:hypothetical protein